jgi:hypothetical protein
MTWRHKNQYEKYMQMAKDAKIPEFSLGGIPVN